MTENTVTAVRTHVQLATGVVLRTNEFTQERADLITHELTRSIEGSDSYPTVDFPDEDGWRVLASKYIVQVWHTSRQVRAEVLDGGQP